MNFKTFFFDLSKDERKTFAAKVKTSVGHLTNYSYGYTQLAAAVCVAIEKETQRKVTRQQLRPNDWQDIWPELAPALANTAQPATETVAHQGV